MKGRTHLRIGRSILPVVGLVLCAALVVACQAPVAPTPEPPRPTPIPQASSPGQSAIRTAWEGSKHAQTFVEGENNACARCHSPMNWTPTDPADMPATCASCKFTIKTPKPVAKSDWLSVACDVCHKVEDKTLTAQVAWLNAAIAQFDSSQSPYEAVKTPGELCEKCHTDSGSWHYRRDLGKSAHVGYACTKCHDAHSLKASCTSCHANVLKPEKPIAGHDAAHANVHCVACHDASGLKVGPVEGKTTWLPIRAEMPGGQTGAAPYLSHNLQRQVDCARCHYTGNPWNLKTK